MGGVLAFTATAADLVNFGQQCHSIRRQEVWSKRGYDISLQSMRIDILNTVREEMRDQVSIIVSSLDNLMVVATLTLSIGFGFVVEGTFPPPEDQHHYSSVEEHLLVVYAVLCALSLVFPLACLMLTIAARFEVELCQQDVMDDLKRQLLKAIMQDRAAEARAETERRAAEGGSPSAGRALGGGTPASSAGAASPPRRHSSRWGGAGASPAGAGGPGAGTPESRAALRRSVTWDQLMRAPTALGRADAAPPGGGRGASAELPRGPSGYIRSLLGEDGVPQVLETDVGELAEGLHQKVIHYKWLYSVAQGFLWLGMICCVFTCSVLLGLFFRANYPETHWVWRSYSGILLVAAVSSIVFLIWMRSVMLAEPIRRRRGASVAPAAADAASPTRGARAEPPAAPPAPAPLALGPLAAPLLPRAAAGAPAAPRVHEHPLVLTQPSDHFSAAWTCDGCRTKTFVFSSRQRYRCAQGCNFDLCGDCHRPPARGAPADTPSASSAAGRGGPAAPPGAAAARQAGRAPAGAGRPAPAPFVVRDQARDGDCLFRCFSDQLYGTPEHHGLVRDRCSTYVACEQERFRQLCAGPFEELLARIRREGEWGDVLEIEALSAMYDRRIEIYAPGSQEPMRTFRQECGPPSREPVRLQYEGLSHYSSLARRGGAAFAPLLRGPPGEAEDDAIRRSRQRREAARSGRGADRAQAAAGPAGARPLPAELRRRPPAWRRGRRRRPSAAVRGLVRQSRQLLERVCEVQARALGAERRLEELAAGVGEVCAAVAGGAACRAGGGAALAPEGSPAGFREKLLGLAAEYDRLLAQQHSPPEDEAHELGPTPRPPASAAGAPA